MKLGLTINTDILMIASGNSDKGEKDPQLKQHCQDVIGWMLESDAAMLVIDDDNTIKQEYIKTMGDAGYGIQFVKEMAVNFKLEVVQRFHGGKWFRLNQKMGKELGRQFALHKGDDTFGRTAMASTDRIIVADEAHFKNAASVLKKHSNVTMLTPEDAVARTKSLAPCPHCHESKPSVVSSPSK